MDPQIPVKNIPTVFIIFGATGDLMGKKIIPALFHLYVKRKLPKLFKIIGFSRRDWNQEQFIHYVQGIVQNHKDGKPNPDEIEKFLALIQYHQGNFDTASAYQSLASSLGRIDDQWNACSNKLFYLAVPPQYYRSIFEHLASSGLTEPCGGDEGWTRVIVEKPFGNDLKTAEELDALLSKLFKEEQLYRIDHYLAKEMLQNILSFRFSNTIFQKDWNNKSIEKIEIRLLEREGVETRGAFYDKVGALRDVGQNHLLQMLALTTMDQPEGMSSDSVRDKRAEVLTTLKSLSSDEIKSQTFRAQYKNYRKTIGVNPDSNTETYFAIQAELTHANWLGVPIIIEGGKNVIDSKGIIVTFKHELPCMCPSGGQHYQNRVIFRLEPKEEIDIEFWVKKPGLEYEMQKQTLSYLYRDARKKLQYIEEYEKLLLDCIAGNQLLFVDSREVSAMWKFIDPIICAWDNNEVPLHSYDPGKKKIIEISEEFLEPKEPAIKQVGIIGLGKMGLNIAKRLREKGWDVVAYNRTFEIAEEFAKDGGTAVRNIDELVRNLDKPRTILLSLPSGDATKNMIATLVPLLDKNDVLIDGANAYYKDSQKNAEFVEKSGVEYLDAGISGGPGGARNGACIMVGGKREVFERVKPLFIDMATEAGVAFFDGAGAGHFVKMVHNGIEYGMMQSLAEGFTVLKSSPYKIDLEEAARIYNTQSVITSRLVGWLRDAFKRYGTNLEEVSGWVAHTGEGAATVTTAKELKVPVEIIERSLQFRIDSERNPSYAGKILAALRNTFGGHSIEPGKKT